MRRRKFQFALILLVLSVFSMLVALHQNASTFQSTSYSAAKETQDLTMFVLTNHVARATSTDANTYTNKRFKDGATIVENSYESPSAQPKNLNHGDREYPVTPDGVVNLSPFNTVSSSKVEANRIEVGKVRTTAILKTAAGQSIDTRLSKVDAHPVSQTFRNVSTDNSKADGNVRNTSSSGARVVIVAHGRSGSSFFSAIFNARRDFFFLFEPLIALKNMMPQNTDPYLYNAEYMIKNLLGCNFKTDMFLRELSRHRLHRYSSRPLVSPPFCNTTFQEATNFETNYWKLCNGKISAPLLNEICQKHKHVGAKILLERLEPADLSWLFHITSAQTSPGNVPRPFHVLYLVRDPRAMIYSRYRLGWVVSHERREVGLESGEAAENVKKLCKSMERNLRAVVMNPQQAKLVRYEDLVTNTPKIIKKLFNELHIPFSIDALHWISTITKKSSTKSKPYSLSRNAWESTNRWRVSIPRKLLRIIETQCERVMYYLGYIPSHNSERILRNRRKAMYSRKIENLKAIIRSRPTT